jgi:hypothetical protein
MAEVRGQNPPDWFTTLAAAETWGMPPWLVESEAPAEWMDRFVAVANERAEAQKRKSKAKGSTGGRRLI